MDAGEIVRLLADTDRRRVFAALVLGAVTLDEVRQVTKLDIRTAATALERLVASELVTRHAKGDHVIDDEAIRDAAIASAPSEPPDVHSEASSDAARVLRSFVRDGRLVSIPTQRAKRMVILDLLAQEFEPGIRYPEREVNEQLRRWHPDTAALRRYLVDEGFLERERGEYWRAAGRYEV